jgi:hypothetical protein
LLGGTVERSRSGPLSLIQRGNTTGRTTKDAPASRIFRVWKTG